MMNDTNVEECTSNPREAKPLEHNIHLRNIHDNSVWIILPKTVQTMFLSLNAMHSRTRFQIFIPTRVELLQERKNDEKEFLFSFHLEIKSASEPKHFLEKEKYLMWFLRNGEQLLQSVERRWQDLQHRLVQFVCLFEKVFGKF